MTARRPHLKLANKTLLMGIINTTPDSFSGDGLLKKDQPLEKSLEQVHRFLEQGVDMVDVGGESTRPNAEMVLAEEELSRVIPVIRAIRDHYPKLLISIDTTKAIVAQEALKAGATMINDVSGMIVDSDMLDVAIESNVLVVITHSIHAIQRSGILERQKTSALSIGDRIRDELRDLTHTFIAKGLKAQNIILDPGIGFGKTVQENLAILNHMDKLKPLGYPILVGASRKSFIGYTTQSEINQRLAGSLAAATVAVMRGADIIRAHDVLETYQALTLVDAIRYT